MTNEMKALVFAHYLGAQVVVHNSFDANSEDRYETLVGVVRDSVQQFFTVSGKGLRNGYYFKDWNYQLVLKPLSDMSELDAVEVAKILKWTSGDNSAYVASVKEFCHQIETGISSWVRWENWVQALDKIRELGYAVPYMGVDLYKAGVAVKPDHQYWAECDLCGQRYENHSGSTPCCGAIAFIVR